nr:GNAT family N-acetyltransferase [Halomonas sp.]
MATPYQHPSRSLSVIPCPPDKRREALLHLAAAHEPALQPMLSTALKGMTDASDEQWQGLLVSYQNAQLNGAIWVQRLPGNMARLWLPRVLASPSAEEKPLHMLLDAAHQWVKTHPIRLCHVELAPQAAETEALVLEHGMQRLVHLDHLVGRVDLISQSDQRLPLNTGAPLSLQPLSGLSSAEQLDLLAKVGRHSLDSPALRDILSVEELLAGFYHQDPQAPQHWYAVSYQQAVVGVLLLAPRPALGRWELLLMGLTPEWRGQGLGRALLNKAMSVAQQSGVAEIMLAVDERNLPAKRIYQQAGFKSFAQQRLFAWKSEGERRESTK